MKFVFLVFLFTFPVSHARLVESLKAQVGGEAISQIEINNFKSQLKQKLQPPSLLIETLYSPSRLLKEKSSLLQFFIEKSMLSQLAKQKNIPIEKSRINKVFKSLQGSLSKKQFAQKLKRVGLTKQSLKQQIQESLQIDFLLGQFVLSKITVSDQDIESYHFTKYKKPLFKNFEYEFSSLVFSEDKKDQVLAVRQDSPFKSLEELAQGLSLEFKNSRLKENQISPLFKKELDKLSISQFSPLFFLEDSYYLLQLNWKAPLISPKEKKKRDAIEKKLFEQKLKQEMRQWIEEQKKLFFIKQNSL